MLKIIGDINNDVRIIDVTNNPEFKKFLYTCLFHIKKESPNYRYSKNFKERHDYLEFSIPRGYHMKILFWKGDHVGMIEYAPIEASGLPIIGRNIVVMNCIWVHRKAKEHNFGRRLIEEMILNEKQATGFATIGLENYWMIWMQKIQMENLGFKSIKSIKLKHKIYHTEKCFKLHLMWMPMQKNAVAPEWNKSKILRGVTCCSHHPLYRGRYGVKKLNLLEIYEKC